MFVRTKISRQNCRLGRSILRISQSSELRSHPASRSTSLAASSRLLFTSQDSRPRPRPSPTLTNYLPERSLATAIGDINDAVGPRSRLYEVRAFDPSMAMVLEEPIQSKTRNITSKLGVPGDLETALAVFDACIRVGKLDRAALVLKKLNQPSTLSPEHLLDLNNRYLESWIRHIKDNPTVSKAEDLHAWYELYIHDRGLPQTPDTIAYMLKASLLTTSGRGTRLKRLTKRYMEMVPPEQGLEVLYCTDILSDSDIAAITKFYPEYNIPSFEDDDTDLPLSDEKANENINVGETSAEASATPEVLSTPQKGIGLQSIKSTLELFKKMRDGYDISTLPLQERREFQSRLERDCIDVAIERWREETESLQKLGLNTSISAAPLNSMLWGWHRDLEAQLKKEFEEIHASEKAKKKTQDDLDRCVYGPILMQSTPSRLAAVTLLATINSLAYQGSEKGCNLSILLNHISKLVEEDIRTNLKREDLKGELRRAKALRALQRQGISTGGAQVGAFPESPSPEYEITQPAQDRITPWPVEVRAKAGAILLSSLTKVIKVPVIREHAETKKKVTSMQPALTRCTQFKKGRKVGVVMPHPVFGEMMRMEPRPDFLARHLPMVVPPEPWNRFDKGAYRESPVPLVRIKPGEQDQKLYVEAALARGDMEQVTKGLDVLGKTAWRINRPVLNVFLEAWNSGEALAKIPALNPDIPIPCEPAASTDPLVRRNWVKELKTAQNKKASFHSNRCFMNFQLEIARAYRDQEFYFPHNIDFRGRAYPIPTYLNHMGADHVRGLLRFSKGKELGERGLMWLKVHLANVYGYDKASLKGRESFAMENLTNVFDSANNPLTGERWWLQAEDPWQCLAACFELKAALESPDPTKFVSALPVHQDGTCNGLQHYAALGGDSWGARQVNLEPGDKPADVYTAVADLVIKDIEEELKNGNQLAKALHGKIKRKVVKQTVMTNVYGVTFSGAKKQVLKQLDGLYPNIEKETGYQSSLLASYVAAKIFTALSTMFRGAHDIQYWLGEIGGRICRALTPEQLEQLEQIEKGGIEPATSTKKAKKLVSHEDLLALCRSTIIWTTPLRMPVVQPYRKDTSKVIQTCMQSLVLNKPDRFDPVNRRKQLQAFPPNFIHSLDASHMILSALECDELGLSFAAVHDSFWTHAADVDLMNRVLRDAFIRIHSDDVIKRLASEFETRYKGGMYLAKIGRASAVAKAILKWRRANRMTGREELLLEKQRMDLLKSTTEMEKQRGKEMVTPSRIYEEFASEADIVKEDMGGTTLGSMSGGSSIEPANGDLAEVSEAGELGDEAMDAEAMDAEAMDDDAMDAEAVDAEAMDAEEGDDVSHAEPVAETAPEADDGRSEYFGQFLEMTHFKMTLGGGPASKKKSAPRVQPISVWLPLTFPKIPEKGDFDVKKLRESEYFFS